jgi:hypothetical protein
MIGSPSSNEFHPTVYQIINKTTKVFLKILYQNLADCFDAFLSGQVLRIYICPRGCKASKIVYYSFKISGQTKINIPLPQKPV